MRYFILLLISLHVNLFSSQKDNDPTGISKQNIQMLKEFDKISYKLTDSKIRTLPINKIYNFIQSNKIYQDDFSLLHVNLKASAGIDDYDYANERERDKNFKKFYLEIAYPIFDEKTRRDKKKQIIKDNNSILKNIQNYAKYYNEFFSSKRKLEFLRMQVIRDKIQVKSGVKYLDEKITKLDKLLELQNKIGDIRQLLQIYKNILLNYVKYESRPELEEILK